MRRAAIKHPQREKGGKAKVAKKLAARRAVFDAHGENPLANPGKESNNRMVLHRPGSMNPRK